MCDEIWIEVVYRYVHDVSHVISRWTVTHTKKKKHIDRYFTGNATRAFYIFSASVLGKVLHKDFLCALEASRNRSCKVGADSWGTKAEVLSKLSLKVTFCSHSWIRSTFISAFFSSFLDQVPENHRWVASWPLTDIVERWSSNWVTLHILIDSWAVYLFIGWYELRV